MEWDELASVKKGDIGERIVDEWLKNRGMVIYTPKTTGVHPFDRLCAKKDKKYVCIVEVKTKAARNHYPDTGINIRHYTEYKYIKDKYGIDIWLFFVDEYKKKVYGQELGALLKFHMQIVNGKRNYWPKFDKNIVYFHLNNMTNIADLTDDDARMLKELSRRSYEYKEEEVAA